ncbi:hypothetical protein D3C80_1975930 [compost metagenome]
MDEDTPPVTRLSMALLAFGWLMFTLSAGPMLNEFQLTMARSLPCCRFITPGVARFWFTSPLTGLNPSGKASAHSGMTRHASARANGCSTK